MMDSLTHAGATRLAAQLRAYWLARGYEPQIRVEPLKAEICTVRSNLVNGRPVGRRLPNTDPSGAAG